MELINRQAVLDIVEKYACNTHRIYEAVKDLPSAQPEVRTQMSSADCISRQEAIRFVKTECNPYGKPTLDFESGKKVIEHLEQMPSAQPVLTCKGCKYDYYEYAGCRNCLRRERDLYEPE